MGGDRWGWRKAGWILVAALRALFTIALALLLMAVASAVLWVVWHLH